MNGEERRMWAGMRMMPTDISDVSAPLYTYLLNGHGPYDGLERTYAELQRWLAELGLRPAGPMWELYWTGPDTDPDPAAWRTEIFAPIE